MEFTFSRNFFIIDDDDLTEDELADKYFITNDSENQTLIYKRGYISNYE